MGRSRIGFVEEDGVHEEGGCVRRTLDAGVKVRKRF